MIWTRRSVLAGGGALALSACHSGGKPVLKVGSQKGGTKALMLASDVLAGADYTVEWAEFPAAQHLLEALGSNAVDIGLIGDAPYLFAYQTGKPLKAVAARVSDPKPEGMLSLLVPKGSVIQKVADLKGRKIATGRGSIGHFLVLKVLEVAGIKASEVEIIFLAPSDASAALRAGAVDAWSTWGAYVVTGLAAGDRIIADGRDYCNACSFDVVHEKVLTSKPAILADFLAREAKAMLWRRDHVADYGRVLAQETGLPLPIALVTAEKAAVLDAPITPALVAAQQGILDVFVRGGALAPKRPVAEGYVLTKDLPKG
jgi:sulfonate transport system substrate-binding protein